MRTQRLRAIYSFTLVILDAIMASAAFVMAYQLRVWIDFPAPLVQVSPLRSYAGLMAVQVISVILALLFQRQYYVPRALSKVDQFYSVFSAISVGTILAVALSAFTFKNNIFEVDYPRAMIVYAWMLGIIFIELGRLLHLLLRETLRDRGIGKDRLLIVGSDETAGLILQRVLHSPQLGYDLIGVISAGGGTLEVEDVPVLGTPEDLPDIIEQQAIDEVIIAMPEKGHREMLKVISYCERGRVSIKVFPDFFQYMASESSIDDLGGLPLLSIRDYAMRGYMLYFKRFVDIVGASVGLVLGAPLMLLTAIAVKLASRGPVFFVQERMGLDGKPFMMLKFRSMRSDAEKIGPGWTTDDDPRQTRLGKLLRKIDMDELPQFINVLIGEMSLVGPRPEQPYYVNEFRKSVPRYMDRHREKAGMTGWAQVNGLRGDTSVAERTKFDLWYSENWSILLDFKIMIRTVWQTFQRPAQSAASP